MKYQDLLTQHGFNRKTVSPGLQKKIREYEDVAAELEKAKNRLTSGEALSVALKADLEQSIEEAEDALPKMDDEVCAAIDKWVSNREQNLKKAEKMRAGKKVAMQSSDPGSSSNPDPQTPPPVTPIETPPGDQDPPVETPPVETPEPVADDKKGIGIGGVLGIAAAVVALVFGIRALKQQ